MKCLGIVLVVALARVSSMPSDTTTARSPPIGETIKQVTNQLMDLNRTSPEMITLDTRTPPKVKQQQKIKQKTEAAESSHAGVAIPVNEDELDPEESTKKVNFYKIERPTTNSGISTWILLSGQAGITTQAPKKPVVKPVETENQNLTVVVTETPNRIVKPLFKKRPTTTRKPTTRQDSPTTVITTTPRTTTKSNKSTTKLTKIKASVLNNAKKNVTSPMKKQSTSTTEQGSLTTTMKSTTELHIMATENSTLNALPVEAKEGEIDLPTNSSDSKKRKTNKRKKNKNRRRKPASDKSDTNSTKIEKLKTPTKEKPISTQLYNYLSREVMPTVGVGLVGLMVTAGLASYFLYPFGIARRSYEVDRRDKENIYYYNDEYSGGIAEEEAIGKVIAGMPANSLYSHNYKTPTSRNTYPNMRYRTVDQRTQGYMQGSVETVKLSPKQKTQQMQDVLYASPQNYQTESYQPISYNKEVFEQNKESGYTVDDKKFVVGNIPKEIVEEVTPVTVPEHGPRSLKIRRRRRRDVDMNENELTADFGSEDATKSAAVTETTENITSPKEELLTTSFATTTENPPEKYTSLVSLLKDLLNLKVRLGLEVVRNATRSFSNYLSRVQTRLDEHYRNYTRTRT